MQQQRFRSFVSVPRPILQTEAAECGLACIANVLLAYGREGDLRSLRRQFPISMKGANLSTILKIAQRVGLHGRAFRVDLDDLPSVQLPAILHWEMSHFVVLLKITGSGKRRRYHIVDPAQGDIKVDALALSASFTGVIAEFDPVADLGPPHKVDRLTLRRMIGGESGTLKAFFQIGVSTVITQLVVMVGPLYMQIAVDVALPSLDSILVARMALLFLLLAFLGGACGWFRGQLVSALGQDLSYRMSLNLTRHIFKLPQSWFDRRNVSDLLSRLNSVVPLGDFVSRQFVVALVSLASLVMYLWLLSLFSLEIAFLLAASLCVYAAAKLLLTRILNKINTSALQAAARENSMLIENLEGMSAIKAFAVENARLALWANRKAASLSASVRASRVQNIIDALQPTLASVESTVFTLVAVLEVISGRMTIGMLIAVALYRQQALAAGFVLVDIAAVHTENTVHLTRISDIAMEPAEDEDLSPSRTIDIGGRIEARNISFSYGVGEPLILDEADIVIGSGQTVAVVGRSGAGKSTLLRLFLGLAQPISGKIIVDGRDLNQLGVREFRSQVGYVAQDDRLFEGSLAENIAFFDPEIDLERVIEVAGIAHVHDEIMAMPMAYETLVGDMGSSLSGGQKARILIARALYRDPRILFIDEGSAHLDVATESDLNMSLKALKITRVIVAHRPETIRQADRVVNLTGKKLIEVVDGVSEDSEF